MIEIPDLSDDELEELVARLTLHALSKLKKLYWRGVPYAKGGAVPGAAGADDFAAEAVEAFLDGSRKWDKSEYPDLLQFLLSVVDSKISHLVETTENRKSRRIDMARKDIEPAYRVRAKNQRPDKIIVNAEEQLRTRDAIIAELGKDDMATAVFECLDAEITKPSEIADYLGVEVGDVNNAQKRLRRAADKALGKLRKRRT